MDFLTERKFKRLTLGTIDEAIEMLSNAKYKTPPSQWLTDKSMGLDITDITDEV